MKAIKYAVISVVTGLAVGCILAGPGNAAESKPVAPAAAPWMNTSLSPDARADLLLKQMTFAEKHALVHGIMPIQIPFLPPKKIPADAIGSSGYVPGIPRLGIAALQESDAGLGVANIMNVRPNDVATALPSGLVTAATFDPDIAYANGAVIGNEAHAKGLNVLLAGSANLARDPRNGRNFEYLGEDPLLAGLLDGAYIRGIQDQHVISTVKHYAVNDQETNRNFVDAKIDEAAMRASDLLVFQIAIETGKPGAVMCSYNKINGDYGCGNDFLLNHVLKGDWHYPGWVMSDWGAVHALDYAMKGLDQQSAAEFDMQPFFDAPLEKAIKAGTIPQSRLDDMVRRILRSMFAVGVIDHPATKASFDLAAHAATARKATEEGIVLLKNKDNILPLAKTVKKIAVIGGYAASGVMSGGGSSQVVPPGSLEISLGGEGFAALLNKMVIHPSSPLSAIRKLSPGAEVKYDDGRYVSQARKLAQWADVVIVFATKWQTEGADAPDLTLPDNQDVLIDAVAQANPKTIVVLETGNPVVMPWLSKAAAVMEAWYPGVRGGDAIANVLVGAVNPSGRLPITFPESIAQNPRPEIPGSDVDIPFLGPAFDPTKSVPVSYPEGSDVGYRWFDRENLKPLFSFGYGLSYTNFAYGHLSVHGGKTLNVTFDVTNAGQAKGKDVPQLYLTDAAGKKVLRLVGFTKVELAPGQTKRLSLQVDPRLLAHYDTTKPGWRIDGGRYTVALSRSASDPVLTGVAQVNAALLKP